MTRILYFKQMRDLRVALFLVCALLFLFELLWARVTHTITVRTIEALEEQMRLMPFGPLITPRELFDLFRKVVFDEGPGKIVQTLLGGDKIDLMCALDMASIGFVHPIIQTILAIWAVGRAAGAIAGEIDRGTMELLLAQPVKRRSVVLAHFFVDLTAIPCLCAAMWLGSTFGLFVVGLLENENPDLVVDPLRTLPSLLSHGLFVFALSGLTMAFSAAGRFRNRVLGLAVLATLVQFLVNLLGQLWDPIKPLRPLTVFFYFDPQHMILNAAWYAELWKVWGKLSVMLALGFAGYGVAVWTFTRRDLPAPL